MASALASAAIVPAAPDARTHAREAGLRYVTDDAPGIRRRRAGEGFAYTRPGGRRVTDPEELARFRALAIPPAWTDVWICDDPRGHLQATGRDARGRKQHRYHKKWRETRDATKYERAVRFGDRLPRMRARVTRDLARAGLPREKVLAAVVRLLDTTYLRIGNAEYAKQNGSFGLTTMRNDHAVVRGSRIRMKFRGKAGKVREVELDDRRVARIVRRCQELPGQELFCYLDDDGEVRDVTSTDVNAYVREISGEDFTAKDFRTWAGTILAAAALAGETRVGKRAVARAIATVAERLGNTPAVCRKCYVHPAVTEAFLAGKPVAANERAVLALLREGA